MLLSACGGGEAKLTGTVIAKVGDAQITKPTLDHWMWSILGGDYFDITSRTAPRGLLNSPPRFATCVRELTPIVPRHRGASTFTTAQLKEKCAQLYDAIKEQTLTFLINAQINISQGAANGVSISDQEVDDALQRVRAEQFPKAGELVAYLSRRHQSIADERFLLKLDLLNEKSHPKIVASIRKGGGTPQEMARRFAAYTARLAAATNCRPGYVVARCRQYPYKTDRPYRGRSPASLLLEIGRWQPATSHRFTGSHNEAPDLLCKNARKGVACHPYKTHKAQK